MILLLSTLLALVLHELKLRSENILLIYVVGVLIVILEVKSYLWGVISSLVFVFAFNFLFITPKYTFMVDDPNYYVSFGIFIVVAVIVSTLTARLQKQILISRRNEEITNKLNKISRGFLNLTGGYQIIQYGERCLSDITERKVAICLREKDAEFSDAAAQWCLHNSMACGFAEANFPAHPCKYLPLRSNHKTIGAVSVDCSEGDLSDEEKMCINTVLTQVTMALERDMLNTIEEKNRIKIEREKLKSNLLRSISHDLRTPLTGIAGGVGFLSESLDSLDQDTIRSMLNDINSDAEWLSNMVENLLNMTRIQDGRLCVQLKNEVVDDIILEAAARVSRRIGNHSLSVKGPDEILLVPVDGQLMIQVLVNLLDNAFRHTKENSTVECAAYSKEGNIIFEVSDNGGGIHQDQMEHIFESFFTTSHGNGDNHRGVGLGLSICQSIIEAHNGEIIAENNSKGGATFRITLPGKVEK